ncbi:MAG: rhodanese-like domain-containing protein [Solirubrobacterales bacterium]|nr:rhodanese-like domain-containing protein [Solirubrobacterales bacterium]
MRADEAYRGLRDGRLALVDVREDRELRDVRIDGAIHLPLSRLPQHLDELPSGLPVAFFCRSGRRAAIAAGVARRAGIDAYNIRGGLLAWRADDLPLRLG